MEMNLSEPVYLQKSGGTIAHLAPPVPMPMIAIIITMHVYGICVNVLQYRIYYTRGRATGKYSTR